MTTQSDCTDFRFTAAPQPCRPLGLHSGAGTFTIPSVITREVGVLSRSWDICVRLSEKCPVKSVAHVLSVFAFFHTDWLIHPKFFTEHLWSDKSCSRSWKCKSEQKWQWPWPFWSLNSTGECVRACACAHERMSQFVRKWSVLGISEVLYMCVPPDYFGNVIEENKGGGGIGSVGGTL